MKLPPAHLAPAAVLMIRLMVGGVFLSEGIQKFITPESVGAGRFAKIGLPAPEVLAPMVGGIEIACGLLVLLGVFTRIAVLPLLAVMAVAIVTTKLPLLRDGGFWSLAHAARNDYCMTLGSLFLLIVGAGPLSWDAARSRRSTKSPPAC